MTPLSFQNAVHATTSDIFHDPSPNLTIVLLNARTASDRGIPYIQIPPLSIVLLRVPFRQGGVSLQQGGHYSISSNVPVHSLFCPDFSWNLDSAALSLPTLITVGRAERDLDSV